MTIRIKIKKTDDRFRLRKFGFTHFLEMPYSEWNVYNQLTVQCNKMFKEEFWEFKGKIHTNGNWKAQYHYRKNGKESRRIYFRGEKFITLLRMNTNQNTYIL